jgi:hypothetical protein
MAMNIDVRDTHAAPLDTRDTATLTAAPVVTHG